MLLLEQDITRKERVDGRTQLEFEADNNEKYEVKEIRDSVMYAIKSEVGHLPRLYYLVDWKGYPEEKNMWESASAVQHLRKLLSKFHQENPTKPTTISPLVDSALPMARSTVKPTRITKQKRDWPAKNGTNKRLEKTWAFFLKISRFSSPISRQDWEIFHRLIKLVFFLSLSTRFGRFFINLESWLPLSYHCVSSIQYLLKRHIFYMLSKACVLEKRQL